MELEEERRKIEDLWFYMEKSWSHLSDLTIDQYRELLKTERKIANNSKVYNLPVKEVITDMQRYGSRNTNVMIKAFLDNTVENTRTGIRMGRHNKIVYFGYGDNIHTNALELALLSAHIPGSSGSGGWGLNGDRRLLLAHKEKYKIVDPEIWIKNADAFAYESQNGQLAYTILKNPATKTILRMTIENAMSKQGQ